MSRSVCIIVDTALLNPPRHHQGYSCHHDVAQGLDYAWTTAALMHGHEFAEVVGPHQYRFASLVVVLPSSVDVECVSEVESQPRMTSVISDA